MLQLATTLILRRRFLAACRKHRPYLQHKTSVQQKGDVYDGLCGVAVIAH
ncbi:MAG: hypothetical protein V7K18_06205 [Nostoc sp.]